jgi:hypothetical protein
MKDMVNNKVKIAIISILGIGIAIGGYIAFKKIYMSNKVSADAKKNRKVFINNKK